MQILTKICDRCGKEDIKCKKLKIEFGIGNEGAIWPLPDISTGDLCENCQLDFARNFFNPIQTWLKLEESNEKNLSDKMG